ncbi:MAG TPA: HEXXH motif domain-containing protein [Streptosporangiaceae bacterium]|nr:HEXXH motif domain-containing protein [Streptosporangiaceae bacterium]
MSHGGESAHHAMPRDQFEALARGGGGRDAIRQLVAAQHSKHTILVRAVAEMARRGDRPDDVLAVAGLELLARVQRQDPAAAGQVIRYPSVGAWALHTIRGDQTVPGAVPSGLAAVAAAAAIKAGVDAEIEVPVRDGAVLLPSLGVADATGSTAMVRTGNAEIRSDGLRVWARPGADGWQDLRHTLAGGLDVVIDDLDPFRMPATDGQPTERLTAAQAARFAVSLREAWDVLSPDSAAEIAAIVRVVVPYQGPESGHVSTSSPQSFGAVAMSRQPDAYTCAETLVHETQHLKLCALLDLAPLTLPDDGQRFYAPWRSDPRPASGLLQGAYAFLGVSGFWRGQRRAAPELQTRQRAQIEFARWRDGAALVANTLLGSGRLTEAGHVFVREMATVLDGWRREPVPHDALALARSKADRHLAEWQADNA